MDTLLERVRVDERFAEYLAYGEAGRISEGEKMLCDRWVEDKTPYLDDKYLEVEDDPFVPATCDITGTAATCVIVSIYQA